MDAPFAQYAAIGGLVVFFVLVTAILVRHKLNIRRTWTELAKKHGLELRLGTYPGVHGTLDGRSFEMGSDIGRKASGRADLKAVVEFYVRVGLTSSPPPGLIAGKRGMLQGAGPVQSGDAEFDKRCWVDAADHAAAKAWLTPARRAAVKSVAEAGGVVLGATDAHPPLISLSRTGYKVKLAWLDDLRERLLAAARTIDQQ